MRQNKHEYDQIIRSIEERGAAREREKYQKAIDKALSCIQDGAERLLNLLERPKEKPQPQPKKRKAVVANSAEIDVVGQFFQEVHPAGSTVTIKNIRQAGIKYGPRIIAAACRVLASSGEIEAVGRKGYRLVPRKENGLDETMSARTPAE